MCKDSVVLGDGTIKFETYHHTNIYNILFRVPFSDLSSSVKVAYIGHNTCTESDHLSNTPYLGLTFKPKGVSTITNFISVKSETKTFIHEFGHFYGIIDHYGGSAKSTNQMITETGNSGYNENCIYGENKETSLVLDEYIICDGCKSIVQDNINLYDH